MSTEEVGQKSTDDNIITRRKHVKQQLNVIRDKKERLHAAMKTVSCAEQPDKELMKQLLEAFDTMTEQEGKYVEIMKDILKVHELAVEDVAKEVEERKKTAPVEEKKMEEKEKKTEEKEEKMEEKETEAVVSEQTEEQNKEDLSELEACLRELQEVSAAAAAASKLNEQLVERLQLQKNKKTTLNEIRKEKTSTMRKTANEALDEIEIAKLKVHTEKTAKDRKEKQLERLRKEALKRGIQQETKEDKEKEEMIAAAEASTERIPGAQTEEDQKQDEEEEPKTEEERMEMRRKEIRENVRKEREKKEQINQQIRERLRAMEARKERVRQLRLSLQQAAEAPGTEEEARQALDDMFSNAAANLANLTAMREHLEAMQLNQEEESGPTDELEEEVRHRFTNVMQATAIPQYDSQQLNRIESLLLLQSQKMNELMSPLQPSVVRFRQSLLTSSPSSLRGLADCLLQLATGHPAPQLDHHLETILGETETRADEESTTKVDPRQGSARNGVSFEERREPQAEEVSRQLMSTIRQLLEEVETIETEAAQRLRQVTCHLVGQLLPSVSVEACDSQLGAQVFDSVSQYLGISSADCLENILYDLEELFRSEISYFALMNNLSTIRDKQ